MATVLASQPCKDCGVPITHPGGTDYPDKGGYNVETDALGNEFADVPHSETCGGEAGTAKEPSDAAKAASLKRREKAAAEAAGEVPAVEPQAAAPKEPERKEPPAQTRTTRD